MVRTSGTKLERLRIFLLPFDPRFLPFLPLPLKERYSSRLMVDPLCSEQKTGQAEGEGIRATIHDSPILSLQLEAHQLVQLFHHKAFSVLLLVCCVEVAIFFQH